ncbi:MAG: GAF domain-containing protein [Roseiflexaceae bacterium]|nr:GAF domain-containing protein [Roseiflexaceae bacterium]
MSVSLFRSIAGQYNELRDVNTVAMMNAISHHIEDQIIEHRMPVDFYAGFQRFSCFPAQMRRYGQLGACSRRVYVFGIPDVKPPSIPGIEFIEISPSSPLAREWFLLVDTPDFWTTLLTQEVEGRDTVSGGRKFDGLWSYDAEVIERASLLMSQIMGTVYQPVRQRNYIAQSQHIAEINSRMIGVLERTKLISNRHWRHLCTLHKVAELLASERRQAELYSGIARVIQTYFNAPNAVIALGEGAGVFSAVAAEGDGVGTSMVRTGLNPSGRAVEIAAPVLIRDMRKEREREPLLPTAQSLLAVPIVGRSGVLGLIVIGSDETQAWSDQDVQTIAAVAAILAAVVEKNGNATATAQLEQARRIEQAVAKLRGAFVHLADIQQELALSGDFSPAQQHLLEQATALTKSLGQIIGAGSLQPAQIAKRQSTYAHVDLVL